jgi:D-glucosaminate-6-phosphate ammonia-lyase
MSNRSTRRGFLAKTAAGAALSSAVGSGATKSTAGKTADVYTRLGVRPLINGVGTVTVLGGSLMPPEVLQAMNEAAQHFVNIPELQKKAGARIAELIGVPAAMVTAGAASGITVGTAACVTLGDSQKIQRLPDTAGMKNEVIVQKSHHSGYEAQILVVGAKLVWVETREELDRAINERTAMLFFLNKYKSLGQINRDDWIRVGKARGVPTFNDAAADVPPALHLKKYVNEGFDLVTFSGGKGMQGPQAAGLLLGRKDLIEAGQQCISPNGGVGRGMKVGKEEIAGMVAAVERYLKLDLDAEYKAIERRADEVIQALAGIRGIRATKNVPEIANHVPHVLVEWTAKDRKPSLDDVVRELREGEPPIAIGALDGNLLLSVWMMRESEHRIVVKRLKEIFAKG